MLFYFQPTGNEDDKVEEEIAEKLRDGKPSLLNYKFNLSFENKVFTAYILFRNVIQQRHSDLLNQICNVDY